VGAQTAGGEARHVAVETRARDAGLGDNLSDRVAESRKMRGVVELRGVESTGLPTRRPLAVATARGLGGSLDPACALHLPDQGQQLASDVQSAGPRKLAGRPESRQSVVSSVVCWYARGMTTKIAISLPDGLVAAAREAVDRGESASVSAFVAKTIQQHGRHEDLSDLLAEMAAEAGAPTAADRAWARGALGLD
jgi:hypothetical protein